MPSKGIYNQTYFINHPQQRSVPAVLYCVVLVNKKTNQRQGLKIGIAKGTSFKDVNKRSSGFTGYQIRTQKIVKGPLQQIFYLQQYLHQRWSQYRITTKNKFGGHTQVFQVRDDIIASVPKKSC